MKGISVGGIKHNTTHSCKGKTGIDSFDRKYRFPHKAFKLVKLTKTADLKRYEYFHINMPNGGYYQVTGAGNVTIWFKEENDTDRVWLDEHNPAFRMFSDFRYATHGRGDFSEFDAHPEKSIVKYEAAIKKAHEGFYKLPPKIPCCDKCDNNPFHKRCPNQPER